MTQTMPAFTGLVGQLLAGKYRVDRVIGEGGMGVVVAATHLAVDRPVAIKILRQELVNERDVVERFAREARAVGRIQSDHVAHVLDVGELPDRTPFMVMEYLEGMDLAEVVRSRGALPGRDAVEYLVQACDALAEAHAAGIVHRDLKPANLFLTHRADGTPCVKVLDFGISKTGGLGDAQQQGLTQTSSLMGSPQYMSPEQLRSARLVDARTDIWSLGVCLHELLTGDVAFRADTVPELYVMILQSQPEQLRQKRPEAPPAVEAAILRCLEKDPARRFANVAELALALREFVPPRTQPLVDRIGRTLGVAMSSPPSASSSHPGGPPPGYGYAGQAYVPGPPVPHPGAQFTPPYAHSTPYPAPPLKPTGPHPALIALLVVVGLLVLGGLTCVSFALSGQHPPPDPDGGPTHSPVSALPFQGGAGWTTFSRSDRRGPAPLPRREPSLEAYLRTPGLEEGSTARWAAHHETTGARSVDDDKATGPRARPIAGDDTRGP
jgi:eukaryotic-like serine/threonine-protein kinase